MPEETVPQKKSLAQIRQEAILQKSAFAPVAMDPDANSDLKEHRRVKGLAGARYMEFSTRQNLAKRCAAFWIGLILGVGITALIIWIMMMLKD